MKTEEIEATESEMISEVYNTNTDTNSIDLSNTPDPEGMEALEGRERSEIDMTQDTQAIIKEDNERQKEKFNNISGRERADNYFKNATEISRDDYKKVKKMNRNQLGDFLNGYTQKRIMNGMETYSRLILDSYLEIMTNALMESFNFTEEMIEELNVIVSNKMSPDEAKEAETESEVVEVVE